MVGETWTAKLHFSLKLKEALHTSCEGCEVARRNRKHQGPSETQKNETIEEKSIRKATEKRTEKLHIQEKPERLRYQEGEGGSRREH